MLFFLTQRSKDAKDTKKTPCIKNFFARFVSLCLCVKTIFFGAFVTLQAEEWDTLASTMEYPLSLEEQELQDVEPTRESALSFFEVKEGASFTGRAPFEHGQPEALGKLRFGEQEASLFYNWQIGAESGIACGIGFGDTAILWRDNPFFRKMHFHNAIFGLSGYTSCISNWVWQAAFSSYVDSDVWNWSQYTIYTLTTWGRYRYCDNLGIHVGFIAQTGIRKDKVQPILGIDFKMCSNWQVNLVYPINLSLIYAIDESWSLAVAGRIFNSRHRVGRNEILSQGIFEYRNVGSEFALAYHCGPYASANIHVGSTLGGELKVTNSHNKQAVHLKLKQVAYIGWAFSLKF